MESINFQYPAWFLIFCALLGLAYALVLYYRDRSFQDGPAWLPPALGFLRWTAVTLISALLLSPLLKTTEKETKRPVIVLAQDESESIRAAMDSTELRDYLDRFGELRRQLEQNYEVVSYGFGSEVRESGEFTFDDKVTNISKVLEQTYDLYSNQNLGAVILASDGIFNEGSNPIYTGARLGAPIYAVALGDTIPKKDLFIRRVFHNQIAYLGDRFSVEIDLSAVNCSGNATSLTISQIEGNTTPRLQQIPIQVQGDDFFATHQFLLEASAPGVQRFRVQLTPVSGEATTVNNTKDFFIDVLDARTRVLIVAHSPHPDLSALKQAILTNKNYEVEIAYSNDLQVQPADFDFVIFHQLSLEPVDLAVGALPLSGGRELFNPFHQYPAIPGAVVKRAAAIPLQLSPEAPEVVVGTLLVGGGGELHQAEQAWVDGAGNPPDGGAFAGGVPAFKYGNHRTFLLVCQPAQVPKLCLAVLEFLPVLVSLEVECQVDTVEYGRLGSGDKLGGGNMGRRGGRFFAGAVQHCLQDQFASRDVAVIAILGFQQLPGAVA